MMLMEYKLGGFNMLQALKSLLNKNTPPTGSGYSPQRPMASGSPWGGGGMQGFRPQMQMPPSGRMASAQPQKTGGILSKLLGSKGGGSQQTIGATPPSLGGNLFGPPAGNGANFLGGAADTGAEVASQAGQSGSKVMSFLDNTQRVLKAAESAGPMIQQYGPMVRNIPSMITMMKEFNNMEDADEADTTEVEEEEELDPSENESIVDTHEDEGDEEEEELKYGDISPRKKLPQKEEEIDDFESLFEEEEEEEEIKHEVSRKKKPLEVKESMPKVYI